MRICRRVGHACRVQVVCSGCAATNTQQTFAGYIYVTSNSAIYLGLSSNGPARLFLGGSSSPSVDQGATSKYLLLS